MNEITAERAKNSHGPMAHPITTYLSSTFMTLAYPRTLQQFYHYLQN